VLLIVVSTGRTNIMTTDDCKPNENENDTASTPTRSNITYPWFAADMDGPPPVQERTKLPRGIHAPPQGSTSTSSKYLWDDDDDDDAPLSPPESSSRSINFDQLGQVNSGKSQWPFRFLNEDDELYFNRTNMTPVCSPEGSNHPFKGGGGELNFSGDASYSPLTRRNIAPAGLGEFDYHIGITNELSWIRSVWSRFVPWPLSAVRSVFMFISKRRIFIVGALIAVVFGSTILHGATGQSSAAATTVTNNDTELDESTRRAHIMDRIFKANVSYPELFGDVTSPQYVALNWISNDDALHLDPLDDGIVPRYACAVFYFSVAGFWYEDGDFDEYHDTWLSGIGICEWFGIMCDDEEDSTASKVIGFDFAAGNINGPLVREVLVAFQVSHVHPSSSLKLMYTRTYCSNRLHPSLALSSESANSTFKWSWFEGTAS